MSADVSLPQQRLLKTLLSLHLTAVCLYQKAELVYAGQTPCPIPLVCVSVPSWYPTGYIVVTLWSASMSGRLGPLCAPLWVS